MKKKKIIIDFYLYIYKYKKILLFIIVKKYNQK